MSLAAQLSIHDVAPESLPQVVDILKRLQDIGPVMLLVIPGKNWLPTDLAQLRDWVDQGHVLAGHGWSHQVKKRLTLYHKLHGHFISRHVAEHLSLDAKGIAGLMQRNHNWFARNGLPPPTHYVPPAWALGRISVSQLAQLPFETVETLTGVWVPHENRFLKIPLMGYEADTTLRAAFLKKFNAWNRRQAERSSLVRISLHPYDFSLKLADDILSDCQRYRVQPGFSS